MTSEVCDGKKDACDEFQTRGGETGKSAWDVKVAGRQGAGIHVNMLRYWLH
jgi:hypothetical protein